jgi:sulfatase maturation enzyme AslB (radical SAM superfamily)
MYNFRDYYKFASDFISTNIFKSPKLSVLMFYATSKCNSKCTICNIWRKQPKENLAYEVIRRTLESKCIDKHTRIGFEGGEFILHPDCDKVLDYVSKQGFNYELLSNGLSPERLAELVKKYKIPRVYISLDGCKETYKKVRGVDGYQKVLQSVKLIQNQTNISIMYIINPWNNQSDLNHVVTYCKNNGLDLRVGLYNNMEFFDTTKKMHEIDYKINTHVDISEFPENQDFLNLYEGWKNGEVILPCYSIRQELVIYPNGDIPVCQNKQIILGNLYKNSLDEIINSPDTKRIQRENKYCNGCWISFHRKFEVALYRNLRFFPDILVKKILGDFKLPS